MGKALKGLKATSKLVKIRRLLTGEYFGQVLYYAVPIGVAAGLGIFMFFHLDVQMVELNLHETEQHHLELRESIIQHNLEMAIDGLRLLAELNDPQKVLPSDDPSPQRKLINTFLVFCKQNPHYGQIRKITASGRETVRVICRRDWPVAVPAQKLRENVDGLLGRKLKVLGGEDIYISNFDTMSGIAELDTPADPVIHFATKLRGIKSSERSFVVIDVNLRHLISDLIFDIGQGGTMMLVEKNGRFLRKPMASEPWGDTLIPGKEVLFGSVYSEIWRELWHSNHGVLESADGLFSYATLDLTEILQNRHIGIRIHTGAPLIAPVWKIVSYVPYAKITARRDAFVWKSILLIPAPLLVTLYLAFVAVRRRRAGRALEESERYLRQIMDSVEDGIVTTRQSGHIEQANAAIQSLFGLDSIEDVPRDVAQLVPLEKLNFNGDLARLWRGEKVKRRLARDMLNLRRKDHSEFPAELVLLETELGGERRFIWIIRDISERKAFEAKQNEQRMRFFHQTKMAEIGLIAAGIIHEVGNPIAALSGIVAEMSKEADEDGAMMNDLARENLKMISSQAKRLAGITREITDFVRTRPDVVELFDLNSLIRSTTRLIQYDSRWKHIRLELELDAGIPAIMGTQDQISQMLMNLLVNAADAVQDLPRGEQTVAVRTEFNGKNVFLTVIDNGHGMTDEAKRHAFDSFFTTKPEGKGTGLGLSLCQTIVSAHEGKIEIESAEGEGATIRILLPIPEQTRTLAG